MYQQFYTLYLQVLVCDSVLVKISSKTPCNFRISRKFQIPIFSYISNPVNGLKFEYPLALLGLIVLFVLVRSIRGPSGRTSTRYIAKSSLGLLI